MKFVLRFFAAALVFWVVGIGVFIFYIISLESRYDAPFDNVVVLTGEQNRIAHAFESIKNYGPENIFISGVYRKTTLKDILPSEHIGDVRVILGKHAKNTEENALEINEWVKRNDISKILLVTSDYHIPRSMAELKRINGSLEIHPCAVKSDLNFKFIWRCVKEFHKIMYVYIRGCVC